MSSRGFSWLSDRQMSGSNVIRDDETFTTVTSAVRLRVLWRSETSSFHRTNSVFCSDVMRRGL